MENLSEKHSTVDKGILERNKNMKISVYPNMSGGLGITFNTQLSLSAKGGKTILERNSELLVEKI